MYRDGTRDIDTHTYVQHQVHACRSIYTANKLTGDRQSIHAAKL